MSKISKNIKMLDILSSGKRYSCTELARMLEVSPRMIRSYKDELEKEGIYIVSFLGINGGYQLKQIVDMPDILFNDDDIKLIDDLMGDSSHKEDLNTLKDKIIRYRRMIDSDLSFLSDEKRCLLEDISKAIKNRESIKIEYLSKSVVKVREIRPLQIYIYNEFVMIVVNYDLNGEDIRHLNLNRIDKIIK